MYYKGFIINVVMDEHPEPGVTGCVHKNRDDSYSIFIDATLCYEKQQEVFRHEMKHILGDDFSKDDVQEIEREAHECYFSDELCPVF